MSRKCDGMEKIREENWWKVSSVLRSFEEVFLAFFKNFKVWWLSNLTTVESWSLSTLFDDNSLEFSCFPSNLLKKLKIEWFSNPLTVSFNFFKQDKTRTLQRLRSPHIQTQFSNFVSMFIHCIGSEKQILPETTNSNSQQIPKLEKL